MHIDAKATGLSLVFGFTNVLAAFGNEPEAQFPFKQSHNHESIESHVHLGWESRYFSEGRDSLDGDSLFVGNFEMGWKQLTAGIWYGYSPDQRYDELQLTLTFTQTIGDFEFYGGYTYLQFPFDDSYDNEIGSGMTWSGLPMGIQVAADLYYSFDADGYFAEISASREFSITEHLTLDFSVPLGINQGYVADGHNGANHLALRLGVKYELTDTWFIIAHTTYSWGLDRDRTLPGDAQLIDFFHGGIGLQSSF